MKRFSIFSIIFIAAFAVTQSAWAFCAPFWPPDRIFTPEDNMHVFIDFEDGIERMVVQPAFRGTIDDFGMIVAIPNRPVLSEAPEFIFSDLENITNPFQPIPRFALEAEDSTSFAQAKSVTIIEEKNISDYTTTTLRANDSDALVEWLEENAYGYTDGDRDTFDHYINKGHYYFVTIKINVAEVAAHDDEGFFGQLRPLEFSFSTKTPIVPIRIMKGDMDAVSLTMYTLADQMIYIPGVDTLFSKNLKEHPIAVPAIACVKAPCDYPQRWVDEYHASDKWLTRQDIKINPREIKEDIFLTTADKEYRVDPQADGKRIVRADLFRSSVGIVRGSAPAWGTSSTNYGELLNGTRLLRWGSRGVDVEQLQKFMNNTLSLSLVEDGIWGPKTHAGVSQFQTQYNLKKDGIVGPQTRKFIGIVLNS